MDFLKIRLHQTEQMPKRLYYNPARLDSQGNTTQE